MVHYKSIMIIIYAPALVKIIIDMIVKHHDLPNSIFIDRGLLFISKF